MRKSVVPHGLTAQHITGVVLVMCMVSPAATQTTQPEKKSRHAELLQSVAKMPLRGVVLRPPSAAPLGSAERADVERSNSLMAEATGMLLEGAFAAGVALARESMDIRGRLLGPNHFLTISARVMARTMSKSATFSKADREQLVESYGLVTEAVDANGLGLHSKAEKAAARAVEIRERLFGKMHPTLGPALREQGRAQTESRDFAAAEASLSRGLEVTESSLNFGKDHPETALVLDRLGWLRINTAALEGFGPEVVEQSARDLRRSVHIFGKTVGETTAAAEATDNLGTALFFTREYESAIQSKLRALVIRQTLLGPSHKETAVSLSNIAWLYNQLGMREEVIPLRKKALGILEQAVGPRHPYRSAEEMNLAATYLERSMHAEAITLLEAAVAREKQQPRTEPDVGAVGRLAGLGRAYIAADRHADAAAILEAAFDLTKKMYAAGQENQAILESNNLAELYNDHRKLDAASRVYEQLVSWDRRGSMQESTAAIKRATRLAEIHINLDRSREARAILQNVLMWLEMKHGKLALESFGPALMMARACENTDDPAAAGKFCLVALQISEARLPPGSRHNALALRMMGRLHVLEKKLDLARFELNEAHTIIEKYSDEDPVPLVLVLRDQALLHQAADRPVEAIEVLRQALERSRKLAEQSASVHLQVLLAKSLKLLTDALATDKSGAARKQELVERRAELHSLLQRLKAAGALDAENQRWLKELG